MKRLLKLASSEYCWQSNASIRMHSKGHDKNIAGFEERREQFPVTSHKHPGFLALISDKRPRDWEKLGSASCIPDEAMMPLSLRALRQLSASSRASQPDANTVGHNKLDTYTCSPRARLARSRDRPGASRSFRGR